MRGREGVGGWLDFKFMLVPLCCGSFGRALLLLLDTIKIDGTD